MRKRLISIVLTLCMVLTLLPTVAYAASDTYGDFTVTGDNLSGVSYTEGALTITSAGDYTIAMKPGATNTSDRIVVNSTGNVTLTLSGVSITAPNANTGTDALTVTSGAVTLNIAADCTLIGGFGEGYGNYDNGGNGIAGDVTISGTAKLTASGQQSGHGETAGSGISGNVVVSGSVHLEAVGGGGGSGQLGGSGIKGNVVVSGTATVIATGKYGYISQSPAITGTITAAGHSITGSDDENNINNTITTGTASIYAYVIVTLPTAAEYAADAASDSDYVLDDTASPNTLHIKTAKGAAWWSANSSSHPCYSVYLDNNIDVSGFLWSPVGNSSFTGTFDGQGHSISGLNVRVTAEGSDVAAAGLFRKTDSAVIKNTGLTGASVVAAATPYGSSYSTSGAYSGAFAAEAVNSTYTNCFVTGSVAASGGAFSYAGGVAGSVAGGVAGSGNNNTFTNCYNVCSVSATGAYAANYAFGMIGYQSSDSSSITNCYSLENCTTGTTTNGISGTSLSETQMKAASGETDALIDSLNDWVNTTASTDYYTWVANSGYPVLGPAWIAQAQWGIATGTNNDQPPAEGAWAGSGSLTDAVAYANDLASGTAYIQLLDHVDITAALEFAEDKTTVLDLNGKTIDRGLTEAVYDGNVIIAEGTLIIKDSSTEDASNQGCITGGYNASNNGGGVSVWNAGTVTLQGGNITGNKSTAIWGGGVRVAPSSSFIMQGGSITGNVAYDEGGGGVGNEGTFTMTGGSISGNSCISDSSSSWSVGGGVLNVGVFNMSGGSITGNSVAGSGAGGGVLTDVINLSGNVNISSNTVGTASDNVALMVAGSGGAAVCITGALTNSTAIGVSIVALPDDVFIPKAGTFTFGDVVTNSDYISRFVSDNSGFAVIADGSQLKLAAAQAITKTDATNGSFTVKVNGNEVPSARDGQTVTVTPTADANYELDTITVTKTGDANTPVTVSNNTFTMPAYAVTINVTFKASAASTPTAAAYAAASPAAAPGTDYVLDDTNRILTINSAKGAAFWSSSGETYLNYTVRLANNIDVSAFLWTPVGTSYSSAFNGTFNGQGYTITGLTVDVSSSNTVYAGLFGIVSAGTVENVTVSGSVNAVSALYVYAGGIAGVIRGHDADHLSYLKNCISHVTVTAESDTVSTYTYAYAGGLAGNHSYTHTINCGSTSAVSASSNAANGRAYAGGLAGMVDAAEDSCVNNSYNTGAVSAAAGASGTAYAGGIAGILRNDYLRNCYNTGAVTYTGAAGGAGGIAGHANGGTIVSCYYLDSTAGEGVKTTTNESVVTTTAKTAADMTSAAFAAELNNWVSNALTDAAFADAYYWGIVSGTNGGYPVFGAAFAPGYAITASAADNGSCTVKVGGSAVTSAKSGDTVTVVPTASSGYELDTVSVYKTGEPGTTVTVSSNNTFTMPAYAVTVSVTFKAKSSTPTGGGGGTTTPGTGAPVIVDGKTENIGKAETTATETRVIVDSGKLTEKINAAETGGNVQVPVSGGKAAATAEIVVKNVEDMAKKDMVLEVKTSNVSYQLPTTAIDTATVMAALGASDASKVPLSVTITKLDERAVSGVNGALVVPPVEFTVTATYNGKTVDISGFSKYVQRSIEVSKEQAAKITTAVVVNADGSTRHVPTNVIEKDGKYYAIINSRTNSTYALINNEIYFTDAAGKWYEVAVNEMGSRKIVNGKSETRFDGDVSITRAEFAAILVRALGLPADGVCSFTDVKAGDWYGGAVGTAAAYGLVNGFTDGSFRPNTYITRQEAMAMVQRAAKVAAYTGTVGSLASFTDSNKVSVWAQSAAEFNVGSGLIVGSNGKLRPGDDISRAETATIILRLLQKAALVDVRSKT
jgi:hypothetical protein